MTARTTVLRDDIKPSTIVGYLDEYVIGQAEAKKVLAVAVYSHYRKLALFDEADGAVPKSNVLLIGPSGSGKTLTCETLSRLLGVPFVTANATSLAQTRYVNEEIEAVLQRLVDKAEGKVERAMQGIVFIDEIDKLKTATGSATTLSGEGVQHALLKIMDGAPVRMANGATIDTSNILFICGGAFVGLDGIREKSHGYGFISAASEDGNQEILERLNRRVRPSDLIQFGLIPEFTGRLPVVASFEKHSLGNLVRILTEPRNAIYRQFVAIFRREGVALTIAPVVFEQLAEIAIEYDTGARSLRGLFEELLTPVLYVIPDNPVIRTVTINSLYEPPVLKGA
ncbi:MAG TPA: AAA family ATPase [Burkholderiales bacterium]|nr:AAA family ATPase [Burkholderiales bacterium]